MERKIGEIFNYKGKKLKVVESKEDYCNNCFLYYGNVCTNSDKIRGKCSKRNRSDNKSVIFVEVKEEQSHKLNLIEILKNCPKGTPLYSTVLGTVTLNDVINDAIYPIIVKCKDGLIESFTTDGKTFEDFDGECVLFPSKEQRDWSKFTAPWYKKEKFDPNTLNPFDKVLVRDYGIEWFCSIFSHIKKDTEYPYKTSFASFQQCIPYNDDTKHLIGTTEEAPDFYKYWED